MEIVANHSRKSRSLMKIKRGGRFALINLHR
jgi:hypothetical protein